jgi:predicted ATPase
MEGATFLRSLRLTNFLSYGPAGVTVELEPLNVLIGPNTSGKSNLIEAIGLLQATPSQDRLAAAISLGGGIGEWLWKGSPATLRFELEAVVENPKGQMPLRYRLAVGRSGQRMAVVDETVENERAYPGLADPYFYYRWQGGHPVLNARLADSGPGAGGPRTQRKLRREDLNPEQSVLAQRYDPDLYPELAYLADRFRAIRLYRENTLGPLSAPRLPQKPDGPADFLLEDGSNLGLVINSLQHGPGRTRFESYLKKLHVNTDTVSNRIDQGSVQIYLHERGLQAPVPGTRLSDGTMRYLCLLTVLCHPSPPSLICIDEPELGLHPDLVATLADLFTEACQRTQLVITTHSEVLVAALSSVPEAVVVSERDETGTSLRRLSRNTLGDWLQRYSLVIFGATGIWAATPNDRGAHL